MRPRPSRSDGDGRRAQPFTHSPSLLRLQCYDRPVDTARGYCSMEQEQLYRQVFSSIAEASSRAMRAVDELRESLDDKTMSEMLNSHVIILYISALDKLLSFAMMFMFITGAITKKELRPSKKTQPGVINTYVGLGEKFKLLHGLGVFNRYYTRVNFDAYAHTRNVHLHGVQLVIAYFVNWSDDKFPKRRESVYTGHSRGLSDQKGCSGPRRASL